MPDWGTARRHRRCDDEQSALNIWACSPMGREALIKQPESATPLQTRGRQSTYLGIYLRGLSVCGKQGSPWENDI